jgi:hypothetical protein
MGLAHVHHRTLVMSVGDNHSQFQSLDCLFFVCLLLVGLLICLLAGWITEEDEGGEALHQHHRSVVALFGAFF